MSSKYPLDLRRIEPSWAERIKSLGQLHGQIVEATERALRRLFNNEGSLIPIPIRTDADRRRGGQGRSRD
jgi:hypothetical protein